MIVGGLFCYAAVTHDASKSGGLDQALFEVLDQPFGPFLLAMVGAGWPASACSRSPRRGTLTLVVIDASSSRVAVVQARAAQGGVAMAYRASSERCQRSDVRAWAAGDRDELQARTARAPTASIAASTCSGLVTMLGPSRRYDVAYGVELATMPCSRSVSTAFCGGRPGTSMQTIPAETAGSVGVTTVTPVPASPSLSCVACSTVRSTTARRPIRCWNANASASAQRCSKSW